MTAEGIIILMGIGKLWRSVFLTKVDISTYIYDYSFIDAFIELSLLFQFFVFVFAYVFVIVFAFSMISMILMKALLPIYIVNV